MPLLRVREVGWIGGVSDDGARDVAEAAVGAPGPVRITAASPMVDWLLSLCDLAAIFGYPTQAGRPCHPEPPPLASLAQGVAP
jgi:hypothetical protein